MIIGGFLLQKKKNDTNIAAFVLEKPQQIRIF